MGEKRWQHGQSVRVLPRDGRVCLTAPGSMCQFRSHWWDRACQGDFPGLLQNLGSKKSVGRASEKSQTKKCSSTHLCAPRTCSEDHRGLAGCRRRRQPYLGIFQLILPTELFLDKTLPRGHARRNKNSAASVSGRLGGRGFETVKIVHHGLLWGGRVCNGTGQHSGGRYLGGNLGRIGDGR